MGKTPRGDVAKCMGSKCKDRERCLRFTRPPHKLRQVWSDFSDMAQGGADGDREVRVFLGEWGWIGMMDRHYLLMGMVWVMLAFRVIWTLVRL